MEILDDILHFISFILTDFILLTLNYCCNSLLSQLLHIFYLSVSMIWTSCLPGNNHSNDKDCSAFGHSHSGLIPLTHTGKFPCTTHIFVFLVPYTVIYMCDWQCSSVRWHIKSTPMSMAEKYPVGASLGSSFELEPTALSHSNKFPS